jgi:hypothetical protein
MFATAGEEYQPVWQDEKEQPPYSHLSMGALGTRRGEAGVTASNPPRLNPAETATREKDRMIHCGTGSFEFFLQLFFDERRGSRTEVPHQAEMIRLLNRRGLLILEESSQSRFR